jgi:hypothetical protein
MTGIMGYMARVNSIFNTGKNLSKNYPEFQARNAEEVCQSYPTPDKFKESRFYERARLLACLGYEIIDLQVAPT